MATAVKSPKRTIKDTAKALRNLRADASVESVHKLRTGLRRIEALTARSLPKKVKRIRKQAGEVRDLDVFRALLEEIATEQSHASAAECVRSEIDDQRRR